jgi:hypothetical protein
MGSLPTFAALANDISVKPEDERRLCGLCCPSRHPLECPL